MTWLDIDAVKPFLQIRLDDPNQDALLQVVMAGTCQALENYLRRPVVAREVTTYSDGGVSAIVLKPTVWSITSVVENGVTLTDADYALYREEGLLRRRCGDRATTWYEGLQANVITYTAGLVQSAADVPEDIRIAAMIAIKFFMANGPEDYGTRLGDGVMIRPDQFPRQSLWLLNPYRVV